jgi:energy-converting hydrogenase Eha subunit F
VTSIGRIKACDPATMMVHKDPVVKVYGHTISHSWEIEQSYWQVLHNFAEMGYKEPESPFKRGDLLFLSPSHVTAREMERGFQGSPVVRESVGKGLRSPGCAAILFKMLFWVSTIIWWKSIIIDDSHYFNR